MADENRKGGADGGVEEKIDHLVQQVTTLRLEVAALRMMLQSASPSLPAAVEDRGASVPMEGGPAGTGFHAPHTGPAPAAPVSERRAWPRYRVHLAVEYAFIDLKDTAGLLSAATARMSRPGGWDFTRRGRWIRER